MRTARILFVTFVAGIATLGVPAQVTAASVPKAVDGVVRLTGTVAPGAHARRVVRLDWRANLAGISYVGVPSGEEDVVATVRALRAGVWGEPEELHFEADESADPAEARRGSSRVFSTPLWLGAADAIDVHVSVAPGARRIGDVRVHLSNTAGNAYEPTAGSRIAGFFGAVGRFLSSTAARPADAMPGRPGIISRRAWGANESLNDGDGPGVASAAHLVFVHHTANSNSYSKSEAAAVVRGIHRYHTVSRDYSDIGYNFIVDRYGQIFEGRAGGIDKAVIGAHAKGFNTGSVGVAMLGTFSSVSPPSALMTSLKKLLAWKMDVHHIPPVGKVTLTSAGSSKYDAGTRVTFNRIAGHRNANDTSCPGGLGYSKLDWLRKAVDATGRPKIYLPVASSVLLRPDGDGAHDRFRLTARFSQSVRWTLSFVDGAGKTQRTFSGSDSWMSVFWSGTRSDGKVLPTSPYTWRLNAKDSSGHAATSASGPLYLVTDYPAGSLISDANGAFVTGNQAYPLTAVARASRFGSMPTVKAGPGVRAALTQGAPMSLRNGALLQGPDGARYIYSAGTLRRFSDDPDTPGIDAFVALGYQDAGTIVVDQQTIDSLPPGPPVQDLTVHPDGTAIRETATGSTWLVSGGLRRPMSGLTLASWYRTAEVVEASAGDLTLPVGPAYEPRIGTLVLSPTGGAPWVIAHGATKRRFRDSLLFWRMGFGSSTRIAASQADLNALPTGPVFG